jgi:hypothetical protein
MAFMAAFELAAPEMFTEFTTAPIVEGAFESLATPAMLGAGEAFMGATNSGILGALTGSNAPLAQALASDAITGGAAAGAEGINAAQIAQQQANAVQAANSGINAVNTTGGPSTWEQVFNQGQNIADSARNLGQVADAGNSSNTFELVKNLHDPTFIPPQPAASPDAFYEDLIQQLANEPLPAEPTPAAPQDIDRFPPNQTVPNVNPNVNPGGLSEMMAKGAQNLPEEIPTGGLPAAAPKTGLDLGIQKAMKYIKENPWSSASMAHTAYSLLKKPEQSETKSSEYNGPLKNYKMSPNFQGRFARPEDYQYTPRVYAEGGITQVGGNVMTPNLNYADAGMQVGDTTMSPDNFNYAQAGVPAGQMQQPMPQGITVGGIGTMPNTVNSSNLASGGIASYDKGGDIALDYYKMMTQQQANPPSGKSDPGSRYAGDVFYDSDLDTRYLDALTAAQIRMGKVNKRANMQLPGMKRPTPMGQLNLSPPGIKAAASTQQSLDPETYAARGGIMHPNLGGYAAGGNPRLLKGPGDGMSDDIPATIANRQPARLADGEFVVPADVVSHLGNGSTDAGAKKLHQMMTNVRKARTGNPKQGKQINPNKYVPK